MLNQINTAGRAKGDARVCCKDRQSSSCTAGSLQMELAGSEPGRAGLIKLMLGRAHTRADEKVKALEIGGILASVGRRGGLFIFFLPVSPGQ